MFALLPHRRAATIAVIGAWLILPPYSIPISGLPDYRKNMAATVGHRCWAPLIFAPDRLLAFRPRWFDLPMLLWCFSGIASSLQNGLGMYDGLSDSLGQTLTWGLPYLLGRIYFGTPEDLRYFAVGMVIGGLCYVLPCIWESRMSPQLLQAIYGYCAMEGDAAGRLSPARLLLDRARMRDVDDGRVAGGLVAVVPRRAREDRDDPLRPGAAADPAGDDRPLPLDRGTGPAPRRHDAALAVGPLPDAVAAGGPPPRGPAVRRRPPHEPVDRAAGRGPGQGRGRPGSGAVAGIPLHVREPALRQGPAAAVVRLGRVGPQRGLLRRRHRLEEAGPDRRPVDHHPGDQGIRRPEPVLRGLRPAGVPVRLALPGAVVGRPPAGGRLAGRGAPGRVHGRLPAQRLRQYHLRHAGRRAQQPGAEASPGDPGGTARDRGRGRRGVGAPSAAGRGRDRDRRRRRPLRPDRPGGSLPHPGTVVQAGGAAARGGGRLAAGPRPARRPHRSRSRRRRSAAAVVRLRQRPGLAVGQSPRSVPPRPGFRRVDGHPGGGPVPRRRGLLEHPGGRPLPRRRRPLGGRRPRSRPGPGRRHGLRRRLPGHGARRGSATRRKPGRRSHARCSRRNATTRATPSWPDSATRPNPSSPATPVPRSRSIDAAGPRPGPFTPVNQTPRNEPRPCASPGTDMPLS